MNKPNKKRIRIPTSMTILEEAEKSLNKLFIWSDFGEDIGCNVLYLDMNYDDESCQRDVLKKFLSTFADKVRNEERERCAKIANKLCSGVFGKDDVINAIRKGGEKDD